MTITSVQPHNLQQLARTARALESNNDTQIRDTFSSAPTQEAPAPRPPQAQPAPPAPQTGTFVHPDSTGRIKHLVLQLDASAPPQIRKEVEAAWTTVFKNMEPDTKFTITLESQKDKKNLEKLIEREEIPNPERFNLLVTDDLNITMWARDQMVGLGNKPEGNTLLGQTTMRPHGDDELLPPRIAASIPGLGFDPDKRLQTDGGDEVSNPKTSFVGYTSLFLTAQRLYESSRQEEAKAALFSPFERTLKVDYPDKNVAVPDFAFERNIFKSEGPEGFPQQEEWLSAAHGLFEEKYGTKVVILGDDDPSTPIVESPATFHVDMGTTPIDSDRVLVGSPAIALEAIKNMTPEEYADHNARLNRAFGYPEGKDSLGALVRENTEGQPELQHNFDDNAKTIAAEGYSVGRLPYLQGPQGLSWVTYNNCLMESFTKEDGSKVRRVFLPTYDLPILDNIAKEAYEKEGFEVFPLKLPVLTSWRGAIRCISNVLEREVTDAQA
jgi:hypothetical protein